MQKISVKLIAESAIIAALYVVTTWLLAPISYGAIQFRISEVLMLLVVLNPKFSFALILGCFISNTTSSLGWYDMVFGTLATVIAIPEILMNAKDFSMEGLIWPLFYSAVFFLAFCGILTLLFSFIEKKLDYYKG